MQQIKTVTEQVYQNIYRAIADGTIEPGTKLTLKYLQDLLGVSSSPIREALTRLQQDGLIEYQPNIGMKVRTYAEKDIRSIFELMLEFDIIALKMALKSARREEFLQKLEQNVKSSGALLEFGNYEKWHPLSDEFHNLMLEYSDNTFLLDASQKVRMHLTVFSTNYEAEDRNRTEIQREHEAIYEVAKAGNDEKALDLMRIHLENSLAKALSL